MPPLLNLLDLAVAILVELAKADHRVRRQLVPEVHQVLVEEAERLGPEESRA